MTDEAGQTHEASRTSGRGAGGVNQMAYTFGGLAVDSVQRVVFETRPYKWVEFTDLPAAPGARHQ